MVIRRSVTTASGVARAGHPQGTSAAAGLLADAEPGALQAQGHPVPHADHRRRSVPQGVAIFTCFQDYRPPSSRTGILSFLLPDQAPGARRWPARRAPDPVAGDEQVQSGAGFTPEPPGGLTRCRSCGAAPGTTGSAPGRRLVARSPPPEAGAGVASGGLGSWPSSFQRYIYNTINYISRKIFLRADSIFAMNFGSCNEGLYSVYTYTVAKMGITKFSRANSLLLFLYPSPIL